MYKLTPANNGVIRLSDGAQIPFADGNTDYQRYIEWTNLGNTAQPAFTLDELKQQKIAQIKQEACQIILALADETKQRNILASMLVLVNKKADGIPLTPDEQAQLAASQTLWGQVVAERTRSNTRESLVATATTEAELTVI